MIETVQGYIKGKESDGLNTEEIAQCLGVSKGMVSSYRGADYKPSIRTAMYIYASEGIVLHPFAKESLEYEIKKDEK